VAKRRGRGRGGAGKALLTDCKTNVEGGVVSHLGGRISIGGSQGPRELLGDDWNRHGGEGDD
jgi:hypothetical protein